ncbi:MAG: hypothetical protein HZA14_08215 [Nitrospirae bacterium]|nr:hypothetical protein [Nitrospirota bacterium]
MEIIINKHASFEAERRGISEELIKAVVGNPQQKLPSRKGRVILQSRYFDSEESKEMLLRVIGVESLETFNVVTTYRTSKIGKYWMEGR